jgi:hypothetical protein
MAVFPKSAKDVLGFELASNTTRQEAFEIANYMTKHFKGVYYAG